MNYAVSYRKYIGTFQGMRLYFNGAAFSRVRHEKGDTIFLSSLESEAEVIESNLTTRTPETFKDCI